MTALAGVWSWSSACDPSVSCERILQAQSVYAPDPPVSWEVEGVAIGRRLARLLPEDRFDRGPVLLPDGKSAVVADARLDNRSELLASLGISATDGGRMCDAQLLGAALAKWGVETVDRLVGDFAFAWWDHDHQRLLLARDFLGQRPLHFHVEPGFVAFASMPKGLHALEAVPREPDEDAVARFLLLIPEVGTDSYFRGVQRVPPGHYCLVSPSGVELRRYWRPERKLLRLESSRAYEEAVREQLEAAVASRLRGSDGRVATHLSGGLDSSIVTSTAARLLGRQATVAAFTAVPAEGYNGRAPRGRFADEGPLAAATARQYPQIEHVLVRTGSHSPTDALDRNFYLFDRPVLNLCNGTWVSAIAAEAQKRHMKVLLTGANGNMSISYTGMELLPELLRAGRVAGLLRQMIQLRKYGFSLEGILSHMIGPFLPAALWRAINHVRGRRFSIQDYSLVLPERHAELAHSAKQTGTDLSYRPRRDSFSARLWALQRVDHGNFNKGYLGGWGVDVRDPTADKRLVELCLSIPVEQYLANGQPRALARNAFADRLPHEVVTEYRKGLQAMDWHVGLNQARKSVQAEVQRLRHVAAAERVVDLRRLDSLVSDWPEENWNSDRIMKRYRLGLLRGLSAGHFIRKATGSNA